MCIWYSLVIWSMCWNQFRKHSDGKHTSPHSLHGYASSSSTCSWDCGEKPAWTCAGIEISERFGGGEVDVTSRFSAPFVLFSSPASISDWWRPSVNSRGSHWSDGMSYGARCSIWDDASKIPWAAAGERSWAISCGPEFCPSTHSSIWSCWSVSADHVWEDRLGSKTSPSVMVKLMTEISDTSAMLKSERNDHLRDLVLLVNVETTDFPKAWLLLYTPDLCSSSEKSEGTFRSSIDSSELASDGCARKVIRDSVSSFESIHSSSFRMPRVPNACILVDIST